MHALQRMDRYWKDYFSLILFVFVQWSMLGCIKAVLEADCSLLTHIVEHQVDHIDLRQSARLNEKTSFIQYL